MKKQKQKLRTEITNTLSSMGRQTIEEKSGEIRERVINLPWYHEAEIILGYVAMDGEADVAGILQHALNSGKKIAVPRMQGPGVMAFHEIMSLAGPWDKHPYGVKEPLKTEPVIHPKGCPDQTVLILVPGLAFDRNCRRLGRGMGFYDRYLAMDCENVITLGIGFGCQLVEDVPVSNHDFPLNGVVTDREVIVPGGCFS